MRKGRRAGGLVVALLLALAPAGLAGQETWVSGWGGMLMSPGTVLDYESGTRWEFGTSFMAGAGVKRSLGQGLVAGIDLGYSPVRHEVRDLTTLQLRDDGRAHIVTAMLSGRLGAGRRSGFGTYLAGGLGAMVYGIPHLDRWDPDFALRGGGGVEYAATADLAIFLEWTRWWVFHQTEGVRDNTAHHGSLEVGVRVRP
jgi:hypothetical protein